MTIKGPHRGRTKKVAKDKKANVNSVRTLVQMKQLAEQAGVPTKLKKKKKKKKKAATEAAAEVLEQEPQPNSQPPKQDQPTTVEPAVKRAKVEAAPAPKGMSLP